MANKPGARDNGAAFAAGGSLWLHGGYGFATTTANGRLNDLWRYDQTTRLWTWVHGTNGIEAAGSYGSKGQPTASTMPGARNDTMHWQDLDGDFWLLGGYGFDRDGASGSLNDLWRYDVDRNEWTWVGGSDLVDQAGTYGTRGVPSPLNIPGATHSALTWVTSTGVWLYGGNASGGYREELWHYDLATNAWTWIGGSQNFDMSAVFGVRGEASPATWPGGRSAACAWTRPDELWLFGGFTVDGASNDLWRYTISTGQWTWITGPSTAVQQGVYVTRGSFDPAAIPGARGSVMCWQDGRHNFWLFGGGGVDGMGTIGSLNDLWVYSPSIDQWAWVNGSDRADQLGSYGALGVAAASNVPGGRKVGDGWVHADGSLWMFGGDAGYDSVGGPGALGDLWRFGM